MNLTGWAIPTATDIAFALDVLVLLESRGPVTLKVLLSAVAVIDDLGAIIIIALFYTDHLRIAMLATAALDIAVLAALNLCGARNIGAYLLIGIDWGKVPGQVALGIAELPEGVDWRIFSGMAMLCGIGFTMSRFIGKPAFEEQMATYAAAVRMGVLGGSLCAAILGILILRGNTKND